MSDNRGNDMPERSTTRSDNNNSNNSGNGNDGRNTRSRAINNEEPAPVRRSRRLNSQNGASQLSNGHDTLASTSSARNFRADSLDSPSAHAHPTLLTFSTMFDNRGHNPYDDYYDEDEDDDTYDDENGDFPDNIQVSTFSIDMDGPFLTIEGGNAALGGMNVNLPQMILNQTTQRFRQISANRNRLRQEAGDDETIAQRVSRLRAMGFGRALSSGGAGGSSGVGGSSDASRLPMIADAIAQLLFEVLMNVGAAGANGAHLQGQPPASASAAETLKRIMSMSTAAHAKCPRCLVCLDEFEIPVPTATNDVVVYLPVSSTFVDETMTQMPCKHIFHQKCLLSWLEHSNQCPTCRYEIMTDNEDYNVTVRERMRERDLAIKLEEDQISSTAPLLQPGTSRKRGRSDERSAGGTNPSIDHNHSATKTRRRNNDTR